MNSLPSSNDLVVSYELNLDEIAEVFLTNPIDAVLLVNKDGNKVDLFSRSQLLSALLRGMSLNVPVIELLSELDLSKSFLSSSELLFKEKESIDESRRRLFIIESLFQIVEKRKEYLETCLNSCYNPVIATDNNEVIPVCNKKVQKAVLINHKDNSTQTLRKVIENNHSVEHIKLEKSKDFIVHSQPMKELVSMLIKIAGVDSTILVQGESGVGKELIVDIIHANSTRREGPLVKLNCSAIPENLLESELFGYEPGAFSGASSRGKLGLFELANKGSIFLDEIGDMPLILQAKILRTLQDMKITRLGGAKTKEIDVRIIVASNRNLLSLTKKGLFREDLYYRLNVIPVYVPALRERKEDVQVLANHFLKKFSKKYRMGSHIKTFSQEAMGCLIDYTWPGNVRELENVIERLVVTVNSDTINVGDLPDVVQVCCGKDTASGSLSLRTAVEETEKRILQDAFVTYRSTYEIARALGVNQSTVVRKAARYGISYI